MERPKVLLTGAAGRVGRMLRPLLRDAFDLRLNDVAPITDPAAGESVFGGDLADPILASAVTRGMDAVVHLAGVVAPAVSFEDTLDGNYRAVLNLLEGCRHNGVRRFVFASSHHILGLHPSDRTYDEVSPLAPDGFYGLSKAFGEAACAMYAKRFAIRTMVIRIGNADPEIVDSRRERMWTSARDLARLVALGVAGAGSGCDVVYGTSTCADPLLSLASAQRLGYRPEDIASEHRAPNFRTLASLGPEDGAAYVGGPFAANELPILQVRT